MSEWKLGFGSGHANCRICGKPITEEQTNIKLVNARVSGQIHSNPFDCSEERIAMFDLPPMEEVIEEVIKEEAEKAKEVKE
jgi:hypothetical protein